MFKLGQSNYSKYLIRTINELQNYSIYKMDDAVHDFIGKKISCKKLPFSPHIVDLAYLKGYNYI